jgi:preprotein translocase subunit YajC
VGAILAGVHSGLALWLQVSPGGGGLPFFGMMAFMIAILYFVMIFPQRQKQKKWQAMLNALKPGDKVVTSGGLRGTIVSLKEDSIILRVAPDNLKMEVSRGFVASVTTAEEGK